MKYAIGTILRDADGNMGTVVIKWNDGDICASENDAAHPEPEIVGHWSPDEMKLTRKEKKMSKYKTCAHCGAEDVSPHIVRLTENGDWINDKTVRCNNCGALGPPCSTQIQADKAWNERTEDERLEKIRKKQETAQKEINDEKLRIVDEKAKFEAAKKAEADRKEREEWEKDEKARILLELEERKAEAEQERIEKEKAEEAEKARQEALRPDKEKLTKWVEGFNETAIPTPTLKTKKAKEMLRIAKEQLEMLLQDIMSKIETI